MSFHEVRFPLEISRNSSAGPERRTEVVTLGSGREERNSRWADSRRRYNAGYGIKSLDDLHAVVDFFEERRGRLFGFRWKDKMDFKSGAPSAVPGFADQVIGMGDGIKADFQLTKTYGNGFAPWTRIIAKPVAGSTLVGVDGVAQSEGTDFTVNATTGIVSFLPGSVPASGLNVSAGFEFDVPVRFDTDFLEVNLSQFEAGQIPSIDIIEVRL